MAFTFSEDFQNFSGTGFTPSPSAGQLDSTIWRVTELSDGSTTFDGTHVSGDFARGLADDGSVTTGGVYAFTTDSGSNTILGIQPGGEDWTPGTITLKLTNNTGTTLTDLSIAYDIFYNNDQDRANSLNFAYSSDDQTYTSVAALDFTTPDTSDGTGFQNLNRSTTINGLSIADGADFYVQWQSDDVSGSGSRDEIGLDNITITCFLAGTRILSDRGEIPIENLQIGDTVLTAAGTWEPVKWLAQQTIHPNDVKYPLRGYPIHIKAGALGNDLPQRDLYVSPDHAMFVDGLLINAGALVNGVSIIKTTPTEPFVYYHVELHRHALIVAEGSATESYLPQNDDRSVFDNGADYEALYPHDNILAYWPLNYPRVSSKRQLPRFVSKRLMKVAQAIAPIQQTEKSA